MNLAKLFPPQPSHILDRERLIARLKSWKDRKLVIIHAQAGQGKSTLAADYVRSLRSPSIWYNMDPEDDNPEVFLSCLGHALQRTFPQRVPELPPLPVNRLGIGSMQRGIDRWLDQIIGKLPQPLLIVFDEFNSTSPSLELLSLMKIFLESTPPHIRFMLLSRSQPDIELARLRANQAVGEVNGEDLKFNDAETHELFNAVYGMPLPEGETTTINRMAEGWAAGLVLMHEYLSVAPEQGRKATLLDTGIEGFRTHVFDYLAQEVFSSLSGSLQRFLLRTSISDYLPAALMERLAGLPGSKKEVAAEIRSIIGVLRNRNLFVTAVDDEGSGIRYHALFREFLHRKLTTLTEPAAVRKLYSTASSYFKSSGDFVRMVDLLISSGQFEQAVRQIESKGLGLIARGQIQTVLRWTRALPLDFENRPWFLLYRAVAFRFTNPRAALTFFDLALARFREARRVSGGTLGRMLSLCGFIEACFYAGGNFKRMAQAAAEAAPLLKRQTGASPEARARLALAIGMAFFFIGQLRQGTEYLRRSFELFQKSGDHFFQIQSASYLASCSIYRGDFAGSRAAIRRGFEALKSIPHETGGEAGLHMAQAITALFEGRFTEAQECINRCFSLAHKHDFEAFNFLSLDIGGWIKTAMGDYEAAEGLLKQCKSKGEECGNTFFTASSAHLLAVTYLHQNKLERAEVEADYALSIRARSGSRLFHAISLTVSGAVDMKRGRMAQAERRLTAALRMLRQCEAAQQEANALLALAELNLKKKREKTALRLLRAGFRAGEERGFTFYYLFSPADLAALAREALNRGISVDFCAALLDKFDQPESAPHLRIFCLGGFTIVRNGEQIKDAEWKGRQAKTLVKMLAAHHGRKYPRDVILEALWPGASPEAQRSNLTSLLHRIRKVIDPAESARGAASCIEASGDHVFFNTSRVWTDVSQFLAHIGKAERLKTGEPARSIEEYGKAFKLYRGDFLPEDLYGDWAGATREQLRAQYFNALKRLAELAESSGDRVAAAEAQARLFQADECNEEACRWLMSYHLAAGNRTEAVRMYERCQLALRRAIDMDPEDETRKLYRSIIGG